MPQARVALFINGITVILTLEPSLGMPARAKVTEWLQERPREEGISLNDRKSDAVLADGVES